MLVAIVDTESTGIGLADQAIAIGVILVEVDERGAVLHEVDSYHALREPTVPIHPAAARVHRLSLDELRGRAFDMGRVNAMLGTAQALIAHNARHDSRMLANVPDYLPRRTWRCSWRQWVWRLELENKKLDTVCAALGVERPLPHNALTDARVLLQCLSGRSGKTDRSKTYLGMLIAKSPFLCDQDAIAPPPPVLQSRRDRTSVSYALGYAAGLLRGLFRR